MDKRRHADVRDRQARDELVLKWLYLPRWVIKRYRHHPAIQTLGNDDAEGAGFIGLLRAAELWREGESQFSTYAKHCIWRQIYKEWISHGYLVALPAYRWPLGDRPMRCNGWDINDPENKQNHPTAPAEPNQDDTEEVRAAIKRLEPRQRKVILLRYWKGWTLKQVGKRLGLCRERVRQIQDQAIEKMRAMLVSEDGS